MLITADRFKTKIKAAAIFHAPPSPNKIYPLLQSTRDAEKHYVRGDFFYIGYIIFSLRCGNGVDSLLPRSAVK